MPGIAGGGSGDGESWRRGPGDVTAINKVGIVMLPLIGRASSIGNGDTESCI